MHEDASSFLFIIYSSFALGFVLIIYFIENIKSVKPKYLNYIFIYAFLNMIAIFLDKII